MPKNKISCLVLAAGKGTRMKSAKAKVLHEVFFTPMIHHVLNALGKMSIDQTLLVVGHQMDFVKKELKDYTVTFVEQQEQLGTGHAVLCAEKDIEKGNRTILIICGDTPLIKTATLAALLKHHRVSESVLTVMTTNLADPTHYGRIICDEKGQIGKIVEEKDATLEQKMVSEVNAGIYCVESAFLFDALKQVGNNNSQGEIYLTDIVELAIIQGRSVNRFAGVDPIEVLGVNSRIELAAAHKHLQVEYLQNLMLSGVTFLVPESVSIPSGVTIGRDTCIHANVQMLGETAIGRNCVIYPNTIIDSCQIGDNVTLGPFVHLRGKNVTDGEVIKPQISSESG